MAKENNTKLIDISLDDILLEEPTGAAVAGAVGAAAGPMVPDAATIEQFVRLIIVLPERDRYKSRCNYL